MKRKKTKYMDKNKNHDNVTEPQHVADNEISVNDIDNEFVEQQEAEAAKDIADEEMNKVDALQQELDQTRAQLEKEKNIFF